MDLLYQRYASPFSIMSGYIRTCRFEEFVNSFIDAVNQDREDQTAWDFYLHKVWSEISYADFRAEMEVTKSNREMTNREMIEIIKQSNSILDNFNPE